MLTAQQVAHARALLQGHRSRIVVGKAVSGAPVALAHQAEALAFVLAHFPSQRAGIRVVDLGCYHGHLVEVLQGLGFDALGVDDNPRVLRAPMQAQLPVVQGNVFALEQVVPLASVDALIAVNLLNIDWIARVGRQAAEDAAVRLLHGGAQVLRPPRSPEERGGVWFLNADLEIPGTWLEAAGLRETLRQVRERPADLLGTRREVVLGLERRG